ncbi:GNAT family N-acetyltransferase [Chryseobacterium sp. MFBS3-17]|uniref:GNAT family N-acetyltransferase n=1 Tax=Chryseobacterium sp. MFBS3-17 TaxID=2886689 RepID=UPI001D0F101D|nr:GNAT family N-acetyltransferase [Chryseobacterium sp. MFBS3-17]MCC2589855.1 N-acetyltransferase family protein [Chryseobacterium sp. MFBS3-17]
MNYELRHMSAEDGTRVLDIYRQGIEGGNATFETNVPTWESWDMTYHHFCRWVLEDEHENVLGWAALMPVSKRACLSGVAEISIYVANEVQRKGTGTILLKKLILDSEDHGIWTLQSGIFPENTASLSMHHKLGFRTVGTRQRLAEHQGVWRDVIILERRSQLF